MSDDEKNLIKAELRNEFTKLIYNQDLRIEKLVSSVETLERTNKEFMDFMKEQQTKPNKDNEKLKWIVITASTTTVVGFFVGLILKKYFS